MCMICVMAATALTVTSKRTINVGEKYDGIVYSFGDCTIFRVSSNTDESVVDATIEPSTSTCTLCFTGKKRGFSTITISKWNKLSYIMCSERKNK